MMSFENVLSTTNNVKIALDYVTAIRAVASLKSSLKSDDFKSKDAFAAYKSVMLSLQVRVQKLVMLQTDVVLDNAKIDETVDEISRLYGALSTAVELKNPSVCDYVDPRLAWSSQILEILKTAVFTWRYDEDTKTRVPVSLSEETFRKNFESMIVNIIDGNTFIDIDKINAEKEEKKAAKKAAKKKAKEKAIAEAEKKKAEAVAEVKKEN